MGQATVYILTNTSFRDEFHFRVGITTEDSEFKLRLVAVNYKTLFTELHILGIQGTRGQ
jgi:hypothetical protein